MSFSVNKVILVGRLGKDPETRFMPNGKAVTNFSLATSEQWRDKDTGDKQERTEWHNLVAYGKPAEILAEHSNKGMTVYIEGSLQTRKWQDKGGTDRYTTEIVVRDFIIHNDGGGQRAEREEKPAAKSTGKGGGGYTPNARSPVSSKQNDPDDFDDDIPF